jgi:thymidylate kinase
MKRPAASPKAVDSSTVVELLTRLRAGGSDVLLLHAGLQPTARTWKGDLDLLVSGSPKGFFQDLHAAASSLEFSVVLQAPRIFTTLEIDLLFPGAMSWTAVLVSAVGTVLTVDVAFTSGRSPPSSLGVPPRGVPQISRDLGLKYLILKRIRKEDDTSESWKHISALARGSAPRLDPYVGERLATAFSAAIGSGVAPDAGDIRRAHQALWRHRICSRHSIRLMAAASVVALGRIQRPAGIFISLGGVDGSGKSTVTDALVAWSPFRRVRRLHSRPAVLKPPGWFLGRKPSHGAHPHGAASWGTAVSALRLVYLWADFLIGYWLRIWPVRARGGMVVSERWWWDMYVDPHRHRLRPMPRAAKVLGRFVPRPDSFFVLDAPSDCILQRKQELAEQEIERQRTAWSRLTPAIANLRVLPVAAPAGEVADAAIGAVVARQREKIMRRRADASAIVAWPRRDPRWLIDPRDPNSLRAGLRLYLPSRYRAVTVAKGAALILEHTRWGAWVLRRWASVPSPEAERAVEWVVEGARRAMPEVRPRVSAYVGSPGPLRKISAVVVNEGGCPVLFAKVASTALAEEALRHEAEVLGLAADLVHGAVLPRVVSVETDERGTLSLLTAVLGSRFDNQAPLTERHVSLISQLSQQSQRVDGSAHRDSLRTRLDQAPDTSESRFLRAAMQSTMDLWPAVRTLHFCHGDLTPWNCLDCGTALGVVDWEMAGYRIPGWDLVHYLVQTQAIAGHARPGLAAERILRSSFPPGAAETVLAAAEIDLPVASCWPALRLLGLIEGAVSLLTTQPEVSSRGIAVRMHAIDRALDIARPKPSKSR